MRFKEFVPEEYFKVKEDDGQSGQLAAVLVSVLQFIKGRSQDQNAPAKINTQSLINLVKNVGHPNFSYGDLVSAHEQMDTVKNMIKSFNKDEVILRSEGDEEEEEQVADTPAQSPEDTVDSMASKALNKRQ
jgi:hypothetical protein